MIIISNKIPKNYLLEISIYQGLTYKELLIFYDEFSFKKPLKIWSMKLLVCEKIK